MGLWSDYFHEVLGILGTLVRPLFEIALACLRVAIILTFLYAINTSIYADIDATMVMVSVWVLVLANVLSFQSVYVSFDPLGEMCIQLMVLLYTLLVLDSTYLQDVADYALLWLAPLMLYVSYNGVMQFKFLVLETFIDDKRTLPEATIRYKPRWLVVMAVIMLACGLVESFIDGDVFSVAGTIFFCKALIGPLLVAALYLNQSSLTDDLWQGGSILILEWLFLELATLPLIGTWTPTYILRIVSIFSIGCVALLAAEDILPPSEAAAKARYKQLVALDERGQLNTRELVKEYLKLDTVFRSAWPWFLKPIQAINEILLTLVDILRLVLSSSVFYMVVVIASLAVLLNACTKPWFTMYYDYPQVLKDIASAFLWIINGVWKTFYVYTNQPDVQDILLFAGQQISALRVQGYRIIKPQVINLENVEHGHDFTLRPTHEFSTFITLIFPMITAMGTLAQITAEGAVFEHTMAFWMFCLLGNLTFMLATHGLQGTPLLLLSCIFPDSDTTRVYTREGMNGLYAQIVVCLACLGMCLWCAVHPSQESAAYQAIIEDYNKLVESTTHGRVGSRARHDRLASDKQDREGRTIFRRLVSYLTSFHFLLLVASTIFLLILVFQVGSPVEKPEFERITTMPPGYEWLKLLPNDYIGFGINTFVNFLIKASGIPDPRIPLLMEAFIIRQFGCTECLCLSLDFLKDTVSDLGDEIGGFFGLRRRLLSADMVMTKRYTQPDRMQEMAWNSGRRNLLEFSWSSRDMCASPPSSCDGIQICLADVLAPILPLQMWVAKLVFDLIAEIFTLFITEVIIPMLPGFSDIANVFEQLSRLFDYETFDIHAYGNFEFSWRWVGINTGALPDTHWPSLDGIAPTVAEWVLLGLIAFGVVFALKRARLLTPVTELAWLSIEIAIANVVLVSVFAVVAFGFFMANELRVIDYKTVITWIPDRAWLYALCFLGYAMCGFFWIGSIAQRKLILVRAERNRLAEHQKRLANAPTIHVELTKPRLKNGYKQVVSESI